MSKIRRNWFPLITVLCLILCLLFIVHAFGQVSPQITGAGSPSNPCNNGGQYYLDTTNHVTWVCPSSGGNWVNTQTTTTGVTPGTSVQGTAPAGSASVGNPVQLGFKDGSGNIQPIQGFGSPNFGLYIAGASNPGDSQPNGTIGSAPNPAAQALWVTQYLFNGSTWDRNFYCNNSASFSVAATTTQIVALASSQKIRVCSFILSGNATAGSMALVTGTGANCVTGQTSLTGTINVLGTTAAPVVYSGGASAPYITPASQALCVLATTTTASGSVTYAQY